MFLYIKSSEQLILFQQPKNIKSLEWSTLLEYEFSLVSSGKDLIFLLILEYNFFFDFKGNELYCWI